MFEQFLKNRLIKKYAKKLPQDLKANYGLKDYYTKIQVDDGLKRMRLYKRSIQALDDQCYAYAMFCSANEFDDIYQDDQKTVTYEQLRSDIAKVLAFNDNGLNFDLLLLESGYSGGIVATTSLVKINGDKAQDIKHLP